MATEFKVGQPVEVVFAINGRQGHVCNAVVERLTPTLVITRNEHGNQGKYRKADCRTVGYHWIGSAYSIRAAK